jgi:chromosome segregation ATPase
MLQAARKSDVRLRPVTTGERSQGRRTVRTDDELATVRRERDHRQARLREVEAERDELRADIAEALDQVEYWRTLAEYRERRLTKRQDGEDTGRERRQDKNGRRTWLTRREDGCGD